MFTVLPEAWMQDVFRTLLYAGLRKGKLMHL